MMPTPTAPPEGVPQSDKSTQLLEAVVHEIEAEGRAAGSDSWTPAEAARAAQAAVGDLRTAATAAVAAAAAAATVCESEPEPEPELEPQLDGHLGRSSIRGEITALRQELARKQQALERCERSGRGSMHELVSTLAAEIEAVRARLGSLGFKPPSEEPPWCPDGAERARLGLPLRVLSIDGGGIKGLVPAIVMEQIEDLCGPHKVHELFDLVVGTSTGGVLALVHANSKTAVFLCATVIR
eukprot:COSAG06_NODE_10377_length_1691_cov_2.734463_2_plen_240_part_00